MLSSKQECATPDTVRVANYAGDICMGQRAAVVIDHQLEIKKHTSNLADSFWLLTIFS